MNAADVADQVLRQVDKLVRNNERAARENWSGKVNVLFSFFISYFFFSSTSPLIILTSNVSW